MINSRRLNSWLTVLGGLVVVMSVTWLTLAYNSGQLEADDARWVVPPGEFTKDGFSHQKKLLQLPDSTVAYIDVGQGPALVLLHGCPFSAFEWQAVLPELAKHYRVIAPDLRGLGDTPVRLNDDYRLPTDVTMVRQLLAQLGISSAKFVAHDHGAAVLQLLMQADPAIIERGIMTNAEAYDEWPSKPETEILKAIVHPLTGPLMYHALQWHWVQRRAFTIAVLDQKSLTPAVLAGYALPLTSSPDRWQRLRRFFSAQLDPAHQQVTLNAVPAMRAFKAPVLLLWGEKDDNFGPELAKRLARDIPGVQGIHYLRNSKHMPFEEEHVEYLQAVLDFMGAGTVASHAGAARVAAIQEAPRPR
jgi:pimeloyl-ACP methyl ester carboxylesterase